VNKPKAIVIYSGGMDSFTTLHAAMKEHGHRVAAFSLLYGQRHKKELEYARQVTYKLGIPHTIFEVPQLCELLGNSALTQGGDVPLGHYADESMKQTVVPNRNMILLSLAIGNAVNLGAGEVWTGMHAGDHAIYPDCRPEFVAAMNGAAHLANYQPVEIKAPFLTSDKGGILEWGLDRGLDYSMTWTCYNGRERACGKCGACVERLEAFSNNETVDPLPYEIPVQDAVPHEHGDCEQGHG
jgi:7-cyano-7-deazaguanine synthase